MTKLDVPPPPRKSRLAGVLPPMETPSNLSQPGDEVGLKDLGFKVNPTFHRRFKTEATLRGLAMVDLLTACFQAYLEKNGGDLQEVAPNLVEQQVVLDRGTGQKGPRESQQARLGRIRARAL